jgi:FMN phosphatase YigB (HAD superfamily)
MRAKTVYRKCYTFDFDECLVKTEAKIHVYRNGVHIKSLNSKEYNFYIKQPNDKLDFSEFNDGELILNAKKHTVWSVLKNVSNAIKQQRSTSDIYILTARTKSVKSYIYEFLKRNGVLIDMEHIITIGDDRGDIDISKEKKKILTILSKKYDEIVFFDDDPKNIKLATSIPKIKTKLIESRYAR